MVTTTMSLSLTLFFALLISTISVTSVIRNSSLAAENNRKVWCVAKPEARDAQLQANLDWLCSVTGGYENCTSINPGGVCFEPNTLKDHASWVMNLYYQYNGHSEMECYFGGTGTIITDDPSHGACVYPTYDFGV